MCHSPLALFSFPKAILHIDGDAFFASCEQTRDPSLVGKCVITGKERGIASSMSYEAKARGVTRAMPLHEIRKLCPDAVILPSDYETYSVLSKRFFDIVRRWTPDVEEYSIDECFADLTGLRRHWRASYVDIARQIQRTLTAELGFTFSIGLAPSKVLAKIASKWNKPHGLTAIPGNRAHEFLAQLPAEKVWGIGPQTTAYLSKFGITTALAFAQKDEAWVRANFTKPHHEIWNELNARSVLPVSTAVKTSYASVQKFKTFTPPSTDRAFILAQLSKNIENACIKIRRYKQAARDVVFLLRTQDFRHAGLELRLNQPTAFPNAIIAAAQSAFDTLWRPGIPYRATGVVLAGLVADDEPQPDLFGTHVTVERMHRLYEGVDALREHYGKHTLHLGASHLAHVHAQHDGDRGHLPTRRANLLKGESARRRLAIPMLAGGEI